MKILDYIANFIIYMLLLYEAWSVSEGSQKIMFLALAAILSNLNQKEDK